MNCSNINGKGSMQIAVGAITFIALAQLPWMVALRVDYHSLILFPRHKLHILELIIFCTVPILALPNGASLSKMLSKLKVKKTKRSLKSKLRLGKVT